MIRAVVDERAADQPTTILELLDWRLRSGPSMRIGFEDGWHTLEEIDELSDQCAEFFRGLGVAEGDRVAAVLHNNLELVLAWFAASKLGAIFTPVNTSYQGEWLLHQLRDAEPAVIVVEADLVDRVYAVADELPAGLSIVVRGADSAPPADGAGRTVLSFDQYRQSDRIAARFRPTPSTISHIIYTSGTTGRSKGCMISHGYLLTYARMRLIAVPRLDGEVSFTALPLFHVAGLGSTIGSLLVGGDAYVARRFSASKFWSDIERSGASYVQLLGSMAPILAAAPDTEESRRCFGQIRLLTGTAVPEINQVLRERFGVHTADSSFKFYGQTEAAPIAMSDERPMKEDATGLPATSFEVRIFDELDREVAAGTIGQIVCRPTRPDVMFSGYWRNPEATVAKSTTLWWHTGDFGWLDEEGYLYFSDRGDDRLRRRGENVSSHELETVVSSHPDVASVAAHAVPSDMGEDDIKLALVLRAGSTLTAPDLWHWCGEHLPKFAVPRYIEFRGQLPLTPTGKIQKNLLRDEGITGETWDRNRDGD